MRKTNNKLLIVPDLKAEYDKKSIYTRICRLSLKSITKLLLKIYITPMKIMFLQFMKQPILNLLHLCENIVYTQKRLSIRPPYVLADAHTATHI